MFIFDAHVDTLLLLEEGQEGQDLGKLTNSHLNLAKMQKANLGAVFFAIYVPRRYQNGLLLHKAMKMVDVFWQNMEQYHQDFHPLLWQEDCKILLEKTNKIGSLLSIEGGEVLEGNVANLRNFYRLGVRAMTLTWNNRNQLADGVGEGEFASGITAFGYEIIAEMNRLGMLIDVSHLAEKGFWDVVRASKVPIIASHSNAAALCQHRRNLTDKQIMAIADSGGVIGVNFCPAFVCNSPKDATIDRVVDHILYLVNLAGTNGVAIGSDFDGIATTPHGLENVEKLPQLIPKLKKRGLSTANIEAVMGKNLLRVVSQTLPEKSS